MRWHPPLALPAEEQTIAARTRKTRQFFGFLREHRPERLDADWQHLLAPSESPEPSGHEPVEAGLLALATLWQASCHVGEWDALARTVLAQRWQRVLDGLGAEHPPCSQGTLGHVRMRLLAHTVDKTLLERTGAVAEQPGGCGARQRRAGLDSPPWAAPVGWRTRCPGSAMPGARPSAWQPNTWASPRRRSWRPPG